jgi:NAD(P)-dependent dehydrogenase (short-subunit alcohol dehydrogenase family)
MTSHSNSVAVVTGGRRGIGRGIALALAASGHDVVIVDLSRDADASRTLDEIVRLGRRASFIEADIARVEHADAVCEAAHAALGRVDVLVNNAGVQVHDRDVDALGTTVESYDRLMAVNMRGTFFLTQAFARRMVATPTRPNGYRCIVTISSSNAHHAKVKGAEYAMSKAGLTMMNKIFALQLAPHGIDCFEIQPGLIKTDLNASLHERYEPLVQVGLTPVRRWGTAEDVGRTVASLAAGGLPFATGEILHVDGGMHIPKSLFENAFVKQRLESGQGARCQASSPPM